MTKTLSFSDLVTACYRTFLQREPENEEVVEQRARTIDTAEEIIMSFLTSDEHRKLANDGLAVVDITTNNYHDQLDIEVDVSRETLDRMFARIKSEWEALGETEPFWSVLTAEQYRSKNIRENLDAFYASGQPNVDWMQNIARRNGVTLGGDQTCFELGCGVGRVTLPLSGLFNHVTGFDISAGNLAECEAIIRAKDASNITLGHLTQIEDIRKAPAFDVLFSIIVLQHNPPPVQKYILDVLLDKVKPGGAAYFQLPTYLPDYAFSAKSYLEDVEHEMEMHAVPMHDVLRLLTSKNFEVLEVVQDNFTGLPGSHSFFATKTG